MNATTYRPRRRWPMILLATVILVPACFGFTKKFIEFLALLNDKDGAFAVLPILNYLLASLGFLFLFGWAVLHGMFRDIERPKVKMLETEERLDAEAEEERECAALGVPSDHEYI